MLSQKQRIFLAIKQKNAKNPSIGQAPAPQTPSNLAQMSNAIPSLPKVNMQMTAQPHIVTPHPQGAPIKLPGISTPSEALPKDPSLKLNRLKKFMGRGL